MSQDYKAGSQEQVVVELNSGRSYFVPREAVERLFLLCPDQTAALVARVSTLREPLDPSGLPSEAGGVGAWGFVAKQGETAKRPHEKTPWCRATRMKGWG